MCEMLGISAKRRLSANGILRAFFSQIQMGKISVTQFINIAIVRPHYIFNLPHIKQICDYVTLF